MKLNHYIKTMQLENKLIGFNQLLNTEPKDTLLRIEVSFWGGEGFASRDMRDLFLSTRSLKNYALRVENGVIRMI